MKIIAVPICCPDTLVVHKWALTVAERDTLTDFLQDIDKERYEGLVGEELGTSPTLHYFEYVLDGQYHHFCTFVPSSLPPVKALRKWVYRKTEEE